VEGALANVAGPCRHKYSLCQLRESLSTTLVKRWNLLNVSTLVSKLALVARRAKVGHKNAAQSELMLLHDHSDAAVNAESALAKQHWLIVCVSWK
jgi:hypothetical protein